MVLYIGDFFLFFIFLLILVVLVFYYYEVVFGFENKVFILKLIYNRFVDFLVGCVMFCGFGCKCFNFNYYIGMCIFY